MNATPRYGNFELSTYWRSSSSWRVRTALACKGILYKSLAVHLVKGEQGEDANSAHNPMMQVPTLHFWDNELKKKVSITQSIAIMLFLEDAFPSSLGRTLLPRDPVDKAMAMMLAEIVNSGTQPLQNFGVIKKLNKELGMDSGISMTGRTFAKDHIEIGLRALEQVVSGIQKDKEQQKIEEEMYYAIGGDVPTIADACILPQLYNARRFEVDVEKLCPCLLKVEAKCKDHEWFKQSHPDMAPDAVIAVVEPEAKKAKK